MLSLEFSKKYKPIFETKARYIDLWGGRGRGGSFTGTQYFLHLITQPEYFRGYFMREIAGDVRESLWRDFKDRIDEAEIENDFDLNESTMTATYRPTGNVIISRGFKKSSGNRTAKLKSLAGATHVLIEEAEEISATDFRQLDDTLRTNKVENIQIIRIFNPPHKNHPIWQDKYNLVESKQKEGYYEAIPKQKSNILSIFSTYYDNIANMNPSTVESYESYKESDPEYYWTIIKGLVSEGVRGKIYKHFQPCIEMPNQYEKFYGLDWGFNDPLALVECEAHNDTVWMEEKIYRSGMTNDDLSNEMEALGISKSAVIVADSAQPKDILAMQKLGWNIVPAQKGKDSVRSGIKYVKEKNIFATENSLNLWMEFREYKWRLDQHKMPTNEPEDKNNHLMDAIRYAFDKIKLQSSPSLMFYE